VYFVGTGCQVAALKLYLRKEYNNLITSDLICHGVPSHKLFDTFVNDYNPGFIFSLVDKKYFNGLVYKLSNFNQTKDIEPSFDVIEYEKNKFDKIWNCGYYNFLWTRENLNK
jgi:hypothetical protein